LFLRPSARASPKNSIVASSRLTAFFFALLFLGAFGAFFPLWGVFDLAFSALFQRPRFFFVFFLLPKRFLRSTNELNKEGKDASHKTHHMESLFSFFVVFFFFCVSKAIYSSRPLFERGEEPHHRQTLFRFLSHTSNQTSAQSTKKKTVLLLCVVRFVAAS
jgi:hypothetical protein